MPCEKGKRVSATNNPSTTPSSRYLPPERFSDYLPHQKNYCLFLDIDGTLADFTLNPQDSVIPDTTLTLLQELQHHGVNIAAITGRSLAEARQMLAPIQLPIAATHGLEIAFDNAKAGGRDDTSVACVETSDLTAIKQRLSDSCTPYHDLIIEDKPYSVALHYRQNPMLADAAHTIVATILNDHANWTLKPGKYVWEIVPKGVSKGTAILALQQKMQAHKDCFSIFIGDDVTDEAGFMAVQANDRPDDRSITDHHSSLKGMGIKVGNEPTCAHYYVNDIEDVTGLLSCFLRFCQQHSDRPADTLDTPPPLPTKTTRPVI